VKYEPKQVSVVVHTYFIHVVMLVSESDIFISRLGMSSEKLRQQFEGQLCKYTNVMKGWQFRWFVLDPETGVLHYYLVSL
jgi:hypothetical protein